MNELTQEHRDNLATLRDFLMTNDVPFDMGYWRTGHNIKYLPVTKDQVDKGAVGCGTAGCAAGWAPFVIPALPNEYIDVSNSRSQLRIQQYVERVFGFEIDDDVPYFASFFDGEWSYTDNTREGAAYRINRYLKDDVLLVLDEETLENPDSVEATIKAWDADEQFRRDKWVSNWEQPYGTSSETPIE